MLVAPFIGSFLGVLIRRLPARRPVGLARSACETCGAPLGPWEMLPVLSYAMLRGRCRHCAGPIAPFHWQIELAATMVALSAIMADPARIWADCAFGWTLLALAWIDITHFRLPDVLTLPLILAGFAEGWWEYPALAADRAGAAVIGYAAFRGVALGYRWLRGRDGLGEGDAKLLAALGAWVGLVGLSDVLLDAALLGLAAAAVLRVRGRSMTATTALPFGACLAAAGWLVRLYANP